MERNCVTVARQTLTLFARVRILLPLPQPMISLIIGLIIRGVAQLGRVLGSGPRGRGFESRHSDHQREDDAIVVFSFLFCVSSMYVIIFIEETDIIPEKGE